LAADLSATETLEETGLYKLLVEQPALDARQGAISAIVGNYLFEHTPPHAELLGRMGKIAAAAKAPFIAAISASCLQKGQDRDLHALIVDSWSALSKLPEAAYLGLTVPRFLLRNPYGQKTDPIDRFEFEEFTPQYGLRGMLWGNSAILAGLLLGQTCARQGLKKMNIGSILSVDEMPYYYFTDRDGDQVALPCTERLLDMRTAAQVSAQGWIPALSIRGRAEVRLGGLLSLAGPALSGPWPAPAGAKTTDRPKPAPVEATPAESEGGTAESAMDLDSGGLDMGLSSGDSSETPAAGSGDSDLDALLASLGGGDEAPAAEATGSEEMDPELAALLASL
jgi:type VI secretion system protein ImpC